MATDVELTPEEAWRDLIEKDDRTSPSEYPEMALITFDELADYMTSGAVALCGDCPPADYSTDKTRCRACPRRPSPTQEQREAVARIIEPGAWRVMDGYLAEMLRKYKGEHAGYDPEAFKHKGSLAKADAILAILQPQGQADD